MTTTLLLWLPLIAFASPLKTTPFIPRDFLLDNGVGLSGYAPSGSQYHLNIFYHLYPNASAGLSAPDESVIPQLDAALETFHQYGIQFHNQGYATYGEDVGDTCDSTFELGGPEAPGTRIEIFVTRGGSGTGCTLPAPLRLSTQADSLTVSPLQASILCHEMGHALGLYHTFQGTRMGQDPEKPQAPWCESEGWEESPYESDANLCGDAVADTPFIYSLTIWGGATALADPSTCGWSPSSPLWPYYDGLGQSQQILLSNPVNFMHWNNDACQSEFSPGQVARMKVAIESGKWPVPSKWVPGPPWDSGGSVPSPERYLFHGALYPQEALLLPVDNEVMFVGETLTWSRNYYELGASPDSLGGPEIIIPTVQLTIRDSQGQSLPESGTYANALPFLDWIPSTLDIGQQFTVDALFVNQFSPYTHTETASFTVDQIENRVEAISEPLADSSYPTGPVPIRWSTSSSYRGAVGSSELVLDSVDILLSLDGGQNYDYTIATGEPNDGQFDWQPAELLYSDQAAIRLVFHNVVNSTTTAVDSSGTFSFGLGGFCAPITATARWEFLDSSADACTDENGDCYSHVNQAARLRVMFWVVRSTAGTPGVSPSEMDDLFERLVLDYAPLGMTFERLPDSYLDDDYLFDSATVPFGQLTSYVGSQVSLLEQDDAITVVVLPLEPTRPPLGVAFLSETEDSNLCMIGGRDLTDLPTLSHEVGHVLGLRHTFDEPSDYPAGTASGPTDGRVVGDRILDTPPDPYRQGPCMPLRDGQCGYLDRDGLIARFTECADPGSAVNVVDYYYKWFAPSMTNIMSYNWLPHTTTEPLPPCDHDLTAIQRDRMLMAVEQWPDLQRARSDLILAPQPGESVFVGEDFAITWRTGCALDTFDLVDVSLSTDGTNFTELQTAIPASTASTLWTPQAAQLDEQVWIRVDYLELSTGRTAYDVSDVPFLVEDIEQRVETVSFPTAGLSLPYGPIEVTWTRTNSYRGE